MSGRRLTTLCTLSTSSPSFLPTNSLLPTGAPRRMMPSSFTLGMPLPSGSSSSSSPTALGHQMVDFTLSAGCTEREVER